MAFPVNTCWSRMIMGRGGKYICAVPFLRRLGAVSLELCPVSCTTGKQYQPDKHGLSDQARTSRSKCLGRSFVLQFHM